MFGRRGGLSTTSSGSGTAGEEGRAEELTTRALRWLARPKNRHPLEGQKVEITGVAAGESWPSYRASAFCLIDDSAPPPPLRSR